MNRFAISGLLIVFLTILSACQTIGGPDERAAEAARIDRDVEAALARLYETTPSARLLAKNAKGILVFPGVVKAAFLVGAQYGGKGALLEHGRVAGYYNIVAASYGLQAGVQTFDSALFFMTQKALDYLKTSDGWELGVGPSIVVVDKGAAKSLTTTTALEEVYAFIYGQTGLMAGLGLQGTKITRVEP